MVETGLVNATVEAGSDADPQQSKPTAVTDLLDGASPTVPSGGFNGRFGVSR